jgi:hypothetical protein
LVSAPSTPPLSALVQMSCTHPHTKFHLRSCLFLHTLLMRHFCLPFPGHIGARRSRCRGSIKSTPAHGLTLRVPSRLSRSVRRTGRAGRCGPHTHTCESRPRACSLTARSAVQWLQLLPPPRPSLPWPQARPPSSRQKQLAGCSACPMRSRSAG